MRGFVVKLCLALMPVWAYGQPVNLVSLAGEMALKAGSAQEALSLSQEAVQARDALRSQLQATPAGTASPAARKARQKQVAALKEAESQLAVQASENLSDMLGAVEFYLKLSAVVHQVGALCSLPGEPGDTRTGALFSHLAVLPPQDLATLRLRYNESLGLVSSADITPENCSGFQDANHLLTGKAGEIMDLVTHTLDISARMTAPRP